MDSGFRRNDELGGFRRNDEMRAPPKHHPHPTLPFKGRTKEKAKRQTRKLTDQPRIGENKKRKEMRRGEEILSLRWATAGRVIRTSTIGVALALTAIDVAVLPLCREPADSSGPYCCCLEFRDRLTPPVPSPRAGTQTTRPARRRKPYLLGFLGRLPTCSLLLRGAGLARC